MSSLLRLLEHSWTNYQSRIGLRVPLVTRETALLHLVLEVLEQFRFFRGLVGLFSADLDESVLHDFPSDIDGVEGELLLGPWLQLILDCRLVMAAE